MDFKKVWPQAKIGKVLIRSEIEEIPWIYGDRAGIEVNPLRRYEP